MADSIHENVIESQAPPPPPPPPSIPGIVPGLYDNQQQLMQPGMFFVRSHGLSLC